MKQVIKGVCPSKSNCYRIGGKGLFKTDALTKYENAFFIQCKERGRGVAGYFELHLDVYYPNQRADLDNSLKVVLDCLQKAKVIVNDNKCVLIIARKFLDKADPRIEFEIREV